MRKLLINLLTVVLIVSLMSVIEVFSGNKKKDDAGMVVWYRMFHVAKNINKNIVVYEIGYSSPSARGEAPKFLEKNPVHPYWIVYEKNGKVDELNFIEKTKVYGITVKKASNALVEFIVKPLPEKVIKVEFIKENNLYTPVAIANINNENCFIKEIFVNTKHRLKAPDFIDVKGISLKSGKEVLEHIVK